MKREKKLVRSERGMLGWSATSLIFTLSLTNAVRLPAASLSAELLALPRLRRRNEYPDVLVLIAQYELLIKRGVEAG